MAPVNEELLRRVKENTEKLRILEDLARGNDDQLKALMRHVLGQGKEKGIEFRVAELEELKDKVEKDVEFIKRAILGAILALAVTFGWNQFFNNESVEIARLRQQVKQYQEHVMSEQQQNALIDKRLDERLKKLLENQK